VVHAQDRLWQMELTRRVALGRVAEVAGGDGIAVDRFIRRLGLHRVAAAEARIASGVVRRMLDAYAAGVNTIIRSARRLPLEFRLLHVKPEPWEPEHTLAAAKLMALGLSLNWDIELQRLDLLRAIGPERAAKLDIVYPESHPSILAEAAASPSPPGSEPLAELYGEAARWLPSMGGASNSWVVAPGRSATGRPILCNDPHLTPGVPSVWYAAHVSAGTDFASTGVTMPGLPFVLIGHNRRIAWGMSSSFADCQDLVLEEFDSPAAQRYRTERGLEATRVIREIIHVRDASDAVEEVVVTRHGPIVERLQDPAATVWRGLALQWTALTPGGAMESMLRLQRAEDWGDFRAALAPLDAPSQSVVYADVDGHIGYALSGRVPLRRGAPSRVPQPGWNGAALWRGFIPPDELPAILDPPDQMVVTANNRVAGGDYPHHISDDYMNGYRALRIRELLGADEHHDLTSMARLQMDVLCPPAVTVARLLAEHRCEPGPAETLRSRLAAWDGMMDPASAEPAHYEAFMHRLTEHALRPLCGDAWEIVAGIDRSHPVLEYPGALIGRLTPELIRRWEANDVSLFDGEATWDGVVTAALADAAADIRASGRRPWGELHALPLEHPFSRRRRWLRFLLNPGAVRIGGNADTVLATAHLPRHPYRTRLFAPSWRMVVDVGDWDASGGIHLPGQSGQPGSRHYRDLRKRWQRNRQFPLYWSEAQVRRHTRSRLTLLPRNR
jgi:penicillin amidase